MLVAAVKRLMAMKLHKAFRTWLILTISASDESSEGETDGIPSRAQQRGSLSPGSQDASEGRAVFGAASGGSHAHGRTTSPGSLDTSADSEAFESPQGVGAFTPVRTGRDSVSPAKTGRGSLSPVQLLRRHEFELRSNPAARSPS
jgi:hypothetical protein